MLRKIAFIAVSLAAACLAGGASAGDLTAGKVTFLDRQYGPIAFAEAQWEKSSAGSVTDAFVLTAKAQRDKTTHLFVEVRTTYLDASGNPTGGIDVSGGATGVERTFDEKNLTAASVAGAAPATRCVLDSAGEPISCSEAGPLGVSASWVGEGPISRPNYEDHLHVPASFVVIDRASGTLRSATASASIGGETFDAASLQSADLGVNTQLVAVICPHGC